MSSSSMWPIDRTLSGTSTPSQSGPGSNGNELIPRVSQSTNTVPSPSDGSVSYRGHSLVGVLPFNRDAVGVFYNPSR